MGRYSKIELRPCPRCGSRDVEMCGGHGYRLDALKGVPKGCHVFVGFHVLCVDCCAQTGVYSSDVAAAEAWNGGTDNAQKIN